MAELFAHQREALAVAAHRNVLLCSASRVGKTFLAAMRVREWRVSLDTISPARNAPYVCVAVAPTPAMRHTLHQQLLRLCSEPLWVEPHHPRDDHRASGGVDELVRHLQLEQEDAATTTTTAIIRIAIVSPRLLQAVLRTKHLGSRDIHLLVLEDADEIHDTAPSLFRALFDSPHMTGRDNSDVPSIFATSRTPVSSLAWDRLQNPLLHHIHVLSMPVLPTDAMAVLQGTRPPPLPLLLCEPFDASADRGVATPLTCSVRDFLLGENDKRIDFVRLFRIELEMGNSAAVYDAKKKQERVNRFILDAESVYQHLGMWCLLKHIELELQFNLRACLVEDVDNINRRRRQRLLQQQPQNNPSLVHTDGDGDLNEDDIDEEDEEIHAAVDSLTLAALIESAAPNLDQVKRDKIKHIRKVLSHLSSAASAIGVQAATPRLLKVAAITRCRLSGGGESGPDGATTEAATGPRCWVFVERRVHCTVIAEYLWYALADLEIPRCCSMLGHTNARIVGSLHLSSYLKIITLFKDGGTNVLVTTSIATKSQRIRVEPPQCDLVVVMDETQEPDKLLDYCRRAYPSSGVVKYVFPRGVAETKNFQLLYQKLKETVEFEDYMEISNTVDGSESKNPSSTTSTLPPTTAIPPFSTENAAPVSARVPPTHAAVVQKSMRASIGQTPPTITYEVLNKDTGAILNLENSVSLLSKFCETLPGLDTYDRRPQYYIKRHPIAGPSMSASLKQSKKKKLKYNAKLDDKIDDIKARAEVRASAEDEDQDMEPSMTDESYSSSGRFLFTAKLRLPVMIGVKKEIGSPKVSSDVEAKAIVAFKACQELVKRGLLDRQFSSTLLSENTPSNDNPETVIESQPLDSTVYIDDEPAKPQRLTDLSAQSSYDLPPVSASELGLLTVRSLMAAASASKGRDTTDPRDLANEVTVSMCFYAIEGIRFAILSSKELYTGNTNTGWRYDFATSDVMTPDIHRVTLRTQATQLKLTKGELEEVLHFHLITMRLACMNVDDAMREVDIKGDKIWSEFSEQNDKGYLVVPSLVKDKDIVLDWEYVRDIIGKPLLMDCWPLPSPEERPPEEWICVPQFRRNVCYVVQEVTKQKAGEVVKPMAEEDELWAAHLKTKAAAGVKIFGRWHKRDQVKEADPEQPLIHGVQVPEIVPLIRRVMQRNHAEASIAQSKSKFHERLFLPEYTSILRLTKTRYFEAMGIVPLLYEFERKCQMSNLMTQIGLDVNLKQLDDSTTKPAYERLEILGDTFLKLETSWYLFQNRHDITEEGQLTQLRRDIIRNDRLNMFALSKNLHHFILIPDQIEQQPFKFWKPSCMGKTPENIVAPSKWIADVLEAMCGAYLVDKQEVGARHFLKWVGVTVLDDQHTFADSYFPDIAPNDLPVDITSATIARQSDLGFRVERFDSVAGRLVAMQQRLKYTFRNKRLLLEAITHPSVGALTLIPDSTGKPEIWRRNYERLEYLGDAVIEYLTLTYAFVYYEKWLPGSITQWKSATVSNDALGKTAIECFGVDECILSGALKIDRESLATVAKLKRRYSPDDALATNARELQQRGSIHSSKRKTSTAANAVNTLSLPKMFADVFEALVAAVFLDSGHNLQAVRDVFLGPLLDVVGQDAYKYVCRESGLPMDDDPLLGGKDFDMEVLRLSSDDEDDI